MILDGFAREFRFDEVETPGGTEYHLTSPWGTVIHKWSEHPGPHEPRFRAVKWASLRPESARPVPPPERSALDRFRNRLASALWVR